MCLHMFCEGMFTRECLITLTVIIWFISSVCPLMNNNIPILREYLVTLANLNSFSQMCVFECFVISLSLMNSLSHRLQLYGLYPVCNLRWLKRWLLCVNALSHWLHLNGFSPVCVSICLVSLLLQMNTLSHWLQLYGLYPVCNLRCLKRGLLPVNALSQWLHLNGLSPVCVFIWCIKRWLFSENASSHWRHL